MAIRIEQPGASESAARAGSIIGKGQRAAEDRARAEREMVRKEEEKARAKAQKISLEWELQKMADQSRRAYEREMRQEDYRLAAEDRAAAWEIEKMELTSRHDFEQEEQERMQNLSRIDAKILALKKAQEDKQFTGREPEYQSMLFNLEQQKYGIKNPRALPRQNQSPLDEYLASLSEGGEINQAEIAAQETTAKPLMTQTATNPTTGEKLISRDGGNTWEPLETPIYKDPDFYSLGPIRRGVNKVMGSETLGKTIERRPF